MRKTGKGVLVGFVVLACEVVSAPIPEEIFVPKERFVGYNEILKPFGADLELWIKCSDPTKSIKWTDILDQDTSDFVQWRKLNNNPAIYHLYFPTQVPAPPGVNTDQTIKQSSKEWLVVTGEYSRVDTGPGHYAELKPEGFDAFVLAPDIDWVAQQQGSESILYEICEETTPIIGTNNGLYKFTIEMISSKKYLENEPRKDVTSVIFSNMNDMNFAIVYKSDGELLPLTSNSYRLLREDLPVLWCVKPLTVSQSANDLEFRAYCDFWRDRYQNNDMHKDWVYDRILMTVADGHFEQDENQNYGFDDHTDTNQPWISVETNLTTTVKFHLKPADIAPRIKFFSCNTATVTVTPTNASGGEYTTLTLTAKPNPSVRTTVIEARADTQTGTLLATLNVKVYNRKTIELCVHNINGFTGTFDYSGVNDILKQAVLFTKAGQLMCQTNCTPNTFPIVVTNRVDLNQNEDYTNLFLKCHRYNSQLQQDVYLLPAENQLYAETNYFKWPSGVHLSYGNVNYSVIYHHDALTYAHELFHTYYHGHDTNDIDNLMNEAANGTHLLHDQWNDAHDGEP